MNPKIGFIDHYKAQLSEFGKSGEDQLVENLISDGDIVFDIGANVGSWSKYVLDKYFNVKIYMFEPVEVFYKEALETFDQLIKEKTVVIEPLVVSDRDGVRKFFKYLHLTNLSTLYPRNEQVVEHLNLGVPEVCKLTSTTLDSYCKEKDIEHIDFLKMDVEGAEFDVLKGSSRLLSEKRIDKIQFEYGGCFKDAGVTLGRVFRYVFLKGYDIFKFNCNGLAKVEKYSRPLEDYNMANYLIMKPGLGHNWPIISLETLRERDEEQAEKERKRIEEHNQLVEEMAIGRANILINQEIHMKRHEAVMLKRKMDKEKHHKMSEEVRLKREVVKKAKIEKIAAAKRRRKERQKNWAERK